MRLLVTRPEPDATRTAERLRGLGHEVIVAPLLEAEFLSPHHEIHAPAAILLTSGQAVPALKRWPKIWEWHPLPLFCVGDQTARAAHDAGFTNVFSAAGDVGDLARLVRRDLRPEAGRLLYVAAVDRSGNLASDLREADFVVDCVEAYRMRPVTRLEETVVAAIAGHDIDAVLVYSRRTADVLADLVGQHGLRSTLADVSLLVLSANIAAGLDFGRVQIAAAPNEDELIRLLAKPSVGEALTGETLGTSTARLPGSEL